MSTAIDTGKDMIRRLIYCTAYSIAMAYVESAVVVYLRLLNNGATYLSPLSLVSPQLYHTEYAREIATMVMLAAVALMQSRRKRVAFAYFLYCYGIWDIFYYVWLKVLIGWPPSLLSRDMLFLIPCPWFGPVLSPSIASLLFIAAALVMLSFEKRMKPLHFSVVDWIWSALGAGAIVASYLWELPSGAGSGHPAHYPWWLFATGAGIWVVVLSRRAVLTVRENSDS